MPDYDTKWSVKCIKLLPGQWSFCLGLTHDCEETYIYINFFKWTIIIGKINNYE